MVDAVLDRLDVAVEHRGVGAQAKLVGRAMDGQPGPGVGLARADLRADLGVEDFGPAAGHAAQARGDQLFENRADRAFGALGEVVDLDGGPGLQVQPGKRGVQIAGHAQIPIERLGRMHAADDVQFRAAGIGRLAAAGQQLVVRHHVTAGIASVVATVGAQRRSGRCRRWSD